jgi:hypothetical protein
VQVEVVALAHGGTQHNRQPLAVQNVLETMSNHNTARMRFIQYFNVLEILIKIQRGCGLSCTSLSRTIGKRSLYRMLWKLNLNQNTARLRFLRYFNSQDEQQPLAVQNVLETNAFKIITATARCNGHHFSKPGSEKIGY